MGMDNDAKIKEIRSQLSGIKLEDMTVAEYHIWKIISDANRRAAPSDCQDNTAKLME